MDLDVLYMVRTRISECFQWHQSYLKIPSELTGIVDTSGSPESVTVLCHRLLGHWPVYHVGTY
jgi:hypothetical protein